MKQIQAGVHPGLPGSEFKYQNKKYDYCHIVNCIPENREVFKIC
jgi:hypothetical protein